MSDKRDIQNVQSCGSSGPGLKTTLLEYFMKTETMTILFVIFLHSPAFVILNSVITNSAKEVLFKAS